MNFITLSFVFFFLFVLTMSALCRRGSLVYKCFLLCFNIFFYSFAGTAFLPLLFFVAFINWLCAKLLYTFSQKREKFQKIVLGLTVAINIALLAFYKYYEFFLINADILFNALGLSSPFFELINQTTLGVIAFPVGLSFYIFQGLSYSIDQYRNLKNNTQRTKNKDKKKSQGSNTPRESIPESFFHVLLYVSFFPIILAGPLMRAHDFFAQLKAEDQAKYDFRKLNTKSLAEPLSYLDLSPQPLPAKERRNRDTVIAFSFILSGLFKKVVLASYLSEHIVRDVFQSPEFYASPTIIMAVYAYAMQIYCDFSGYSDLAVGIGALMGYHLPQNFNAPYLASSLQDFWRRWHITLSTWLRDYLYIPLGGSKKGSRTFNLVITMTLGGLWHGSHLHFLIWGFMHGVGLSIVHTTKKLLAWIFIPPLSYIRSFLGWFITFHFVCLLWIFFRASDTENAFFILERISQLDCKGDGFDALVPLVVLLAFCIQIIGPHVFRFHVYIMEKLWAPLQIVLIALFCAIILQLGPEGVMPFIYFNF